MTRHSPTPDDNAARAGAEIEVPAGQAPAAAHTTRTIADVDPDEIGATDPATTDPKPVTDVNPANT